MMLHGSRAFSRPAILVLLVVLPLACGCRVRSTGQNALGVRLYQNGRYAEALQQFQEAQQADPSNPDAYYNLASTYHKLGVAQNDANLITQAESLYGQCLDFSPNHVDCYRGLAVLLVESKRRDAAFRLLNKWQVANPGLSDPFVELARLNKELGNAELAARYLDDAIATNVNDPRAWAARAELHETSGDYARAMQDYQQSLAINKFQPAVAERVALLNVRLAQNAMNQQVNQWTATNPAVGGQKRY
ncbi:MAG TPA: hypothetical protein DDW52_08225 [Planctomycetaceae bacterium]|nr:hypothetical protein [Planctomycetaceae bacterium]